MKKAPLFLILFLAVFAFQANGQASVSDADKAAIAATALDYIEGWYTGDAASAWSERCIPIWRNAS
ncbi:MAG TPA: hypothetical protein VGC97_22820 [Pyrinomonadaceae bacterium]|jgi:hypothetical protein